MCSECIACCCLSPRHSLCCRPPPHDAWAGGSFAAITRGLLRPSCPRWAARLAGLTGSRRACQRRQWRDNVRPARKASGPLRDKIRPAADPLGLTREKVRPARCFQRLLREKTRPARLKTAFFSRFGLAGRTFSRSRPRSDRAGRTFSRTGHRHVPTLKPMTPLQPLMQASMKPPTPLQPKNARKTAFSHPQRRWRFQLGLGRHTQRRQRFQTTGPAGRQGLAAVPVGGGEAWPGDQWAADVTNVVKPTRFKSPREDLCYKHRQSEPKNQHFHRKSRWIDDVCNNGAEIHTKNTLD